jgi:hypothetical protein
MKFRRQFRRVLRPVTGRRLSAARRALQRQAEEVALFPELQPTETPEQRIARLDVEADAHFQRLRDHTAAMVADRQVRRARRAFRTRQHFH